jgi:hypothetical protein
MNEPNEPELVPSIRGKLHLVLLYDAATAPFEPHASNDVTA